ncbi:DUF1993 domain-containing protein [Aquabacter spiritensis]|uniref:DUF1993 domain-containing protein n=1 Tax=Aquabacter spiritensis TaxID=933073 RepID=A0A4R3M0N9_9HYPH|nr:DUF1993 domain-containing protein [Aquabacter spiritensis]TCT06641.1 hypothetical protein EDC64_102119 [Aquabacter spiritensis]
MSTYAYTVPVLVRGLTILSGYMDKAAAFAAETGTDPAALIGARLAPDMLPLAGQVQRASDTAKASITRLTGLEAPSFPDTETTFPELKERIAKTIAFVETATPADFEGSDAREIDLRVVTTTGADYPALFMLPNFFFHLATAHALLRQAGVAVGKKDYLGIA